MLDAGPHQTGESQLTEGDWQAVHKYLREEIWNPANEKAEKLLEELGNAGRALLDGLPGTPVYELGRCLQGAALGEAVTPSGDKFSRRLVDLLLAGQRDSGAAAALAEFLADEANAARLAENNQSAEGSARAAEENYDDSSWDVPLYNSNLHCDELTHLGHFWQLASLEAAFWSALSNWSGDHLKRLAETAQSFQEEVGAYEQFLAETAPSAGTRTEE